jgi:hypothetical protein
MALKWRADVQFAVRWQMKAYSVLVDRSIDES